MQILIVEHFPVVRAGIRQWLSATPDLVIAGETASAREGVSMAASLQLDIVLLDIATPHKNGYEALLAFKETRQTLPVLIINGHPEQFHALQLMNSGASGCFPANGESDELIRAIRAVGSGKHYPEEIAPRRQVELDGEPRALHEKLSPREYEIFHSICRGERLTETADRLSLSLSTVNRYRKQVLVKIGVEDIPGLIRYAVHQGIDGFQY
ncbi:MAG TPA: response regulator transcription factor [Oxalicibacterium sp.]|uniref:response regulator transcription factor n=1 Tax=Oxalicibacterium sp. TaxID=2766525 RepID=UPI002BDDF65E|nr:response regulator transcription factor [Oxalicibacterium sp.]HWU96978.1 response regulator transcription factor [Oxalicibacterium sp.]